MDTNIISFSMFVHSIHNEGKKYQLHPFDSMNLSARQYRLINAAARDT